MVEYFAQEEDLKMVSKFSQLKLNGWINEELFLQKKTPRPWDLQENHVSRAIVKLRLSEDKTMVMFAVSYCK